MNRAIKAAGGKRVRAFSLAALMTIALLWSGSAFAQQSATFPADEAGISAYVNVEQNIDLAKAKSALRGIQAEGSNYVIGIMELPGLPEEEFPHMYISSDGWILAYYSQFAPASRIMHWGKYGGRRCFEFPGRGTASGTAG